MMTELCPLGLECPEQKDEECVNIEACHYWTASWELYEIFILADLPAIFLHTGKRDEWTEPEYGFIQLGSTDFILYYAAKHGDYISWRKLYDLSGYGFKRKYFYRAYVRSYHAEFFENLRREIDTEYADAVDFDPDIDSIPF